MPSVLSVEESVNTANRSEVWRPVIKDMLCWKAEDKIKTSIKINDSS
jgi:hypothetical protein